MSVKDLSDPPHEFPKQLVSPLQNILTDIREKIFTYWVLKRTSNHFQCIIKPPAIWREENQKQRVNNRSVFNAFCKIRFGLDRARLVVDMMVRREKKKAHLFEVMSKISHLQLQQLRNSRSNPILKDDPSLAGNWGFISTVHLDDNVYVNPDNLRDANLEFVIDKMNLRKPVVMDTNPEFNVFATKLKPKPRKDHQPTAIKRLIRKSLIAKQQIDHEQSCVMKIPKDQLIVADFTKQNIVKKLQEPVFVCHYLVPVLPDLLDSRKLEFAIARTKKEENDVSLATELPEESDSSNSIQDVRLDASELFYTPTPPKKICVKICNSEDGRERSCEKRLLPPRNIFDDFIADQL